MTIRIYQQNGQQQYVTIVTSMPEMDAGHSYYSFRMETLYAFVWNCFPSMFNNQMACCSHVTTA